MEASVRVMHVLLIMGSFKSTHTSRVEIDGEEQIRYRVEQSRAERVKGLVAVTFG